MNLQGKVAMVAVGGNSLITDKDHQSIPDQYIAAAESSRYIAEMVEAGVTVILAHGNGPQVGFILRRSGIAKSLVPEVPVDYADADTQGAIGYMFQRSLYNEFKRRGLPRKVVTVVTQVLVDGNDPALSKPTKPIGDYMDEATAQSLAKNFGWTVSEDAGRGWRRVVGSPKPKRIIELDTIKGLVAQGTIVIACGGGGIPVVENSTGEIEGLEAVIDKDFAAALLARELGADLFVVSTAVEKVAINFNKPNQKWLDHITLAEAKQLLNEGHFPAGSMGPKVEAIASFLEAGGDRRAIITNPPNLGRALNNATGTHFVVG
ncbi:MAG TPA: carbamate kinase [Xanthobacteraceae bacterium]|jgi:carbamate kinase|nr:carbamate kinase [Xanthobacteraceae bacterium]